MDSPAIQNLEFLRMLIAEARRGVPMEDMEKLRMLVYAPPMISEPQEDRQ
jgi:hypothetical protein